MSGAQTATEVRCASLWYLDRQRAAAGSTAHAEPFTVARFVQALNESPLNRGAILTMLATLDTADANGVTEYSGRHIAAVRGVRANTVSDHWKQARGSGLLLTQRRYNTSGLQLLSWPGRVVEFPESGVTFKRVHTWTDAEQAWWDAGANVPAPWAQDSWPPF